MLHVLVVAFSLSYFISGLDLADNELFQVMMSETDVSRKAYMMSKGIPKFQESFTAIERVSVFLTNCSHI